MIAREAVELARLLGLANLGGGPLLASCREGMTCPVFEVTTNFLDVVNAGIFVDALLKLG